jgi:hypothetical protein
MSELPNDIIEKIWKAYFTMFVIPDIRLWWKPLHGCRFNHNITYYGEDFITNVVGWTSSYLHCFWPSFNTWESPEFREYLKTHKYCWVDTVYIKADGCDMEDIKFKFQKYFHNGSVEINSNNKIRIDFKHYYMDSVKFSLNHCEIDTRDFEWKSLDLKIDGHNKIAYLEDPYTKQKSKRLYDNSHKYDYKPDSTIPWLVYIP